MSRKWCVTGLRLCRLVICGRGFIIDSAFRSDVRWRYRMFWGIRRADPIGVITWSRMWSFLLRGGRGVL